MQHQQHLEGVAISVANELGKYSWFVDILIADKIESPHLVIYSRQKTEAEMVLSELQKTIQFDFRVFKSTSISFMKS